MLAIVYRGMIPILWTLLNKRGNSDTKERIALIQRFIAIFGKDRIVNVLQTESLSVSSGLHG
ncbi:hypothetical protein KHAB170019_13600 [Acinetobacter baumannii]|nr:hypothetical protein KHAB170019_13600 [Acinetobacter baumannii]